MSEPASIIITKGEGSYKAYWSEKTDSHVDIIKEFSLKDVPNVRGEARLIPCEVVPPDGDFLVPLDKWKFKSDIRPEWADMAEVEKECRKALIAWVGARLVLPTQKRELKAGEQVYCIGGSVEAWENSSV